jgi:hypothetical protein
MLILPPDTQRFIDLEGLAGLYAAPTKNALIGIVAIERIRVINFVRLRSKRDLLMFDGQQLGRVMDSTIAVVVVANRAVEQVVAENAIKCLHLGGRRLRRLGGDLHSVGDSGRAGPDQAAVHFNHARVTCLNRAELRVVADMGDRHASTVDQIDEKLAGSGFLNDTINRKVDHGCFLPTIPCKSGSSRVRE